MRRHSATVSVSKTLAVWNLRPRPKRTQACGGACAMSCPSIRTVPALRSAPSLMQRISVVLPAPLGPIRLTSSPRCATKSMPDSTFRLPKCFDTPASSITGAPLSTTGRTGASASTAVPAACATSAAAALLRRPNRRSRRARGGSKPCGSSTITRTKATPRNSFQMKGRLPLR